MKAKRPQLISLPIFWQVLGLSLLVLVLALGINTYFVLNAPEPTPSGYRMSEAVAALKTGQAKLPDGRWLKSETTTDAPDYVVKNPNHTAQHGPFQGLIATRLASGLGVPADQIWIDLKMHDRGNGFMRRHHARYDDNNGPGAGNGSPADGPGMATGIGGPGIGGPVGPPADTPPQGPGNAMGAPPPANPGPDQLNPGRFAPGGPGPVESDMESSHERTLLRYMTGNDKEHTEILYPPFSAAWKQSDGSYRTISPPRDLINPWQMRLLLGFGLTALIILPLVWLLSRRLSRPIIAFSEAAGRLAFEDDSPPVLSAGPREVRAAADVLNAMQVRIKKQVETRTALMAAIAHDLKTPLARLRLRIEDLPGPLRDKIAGDISHMDGLIRSAMSFTSAHKMAETLRPLDMSALVEVLCDDLSPLCAMDAAQIEGNVMIMGDTVALKRIITNLVENAGRYAGSCRVELATHGKNVEISIIDKGPGLPPEALEAVFEPFYRLESSRNRDTGGSGLGLSVARSLTEAQGGTLKLANRYDGDTIVGLEARLSLPRLVRT